MRMPAKIFFFFVLLILPINTYSTEWVKHYVMRGTGYETIFHSYETGKKGPLVVLIAPHADERSAPLYLQQIVKHLRPDRGKLMIWAVPVKPAWIRKKRFWNEDFNRQFGPGTDNYMPEDIIAGVLKNWLIENKPDLVLNVHEGMPHFRYNWHGYGQSLVIDTEEMVPLCQRVVRRVNYRIRKKNRYMIAVKPMETTLTWWVRQHGMKAVGVEIYRNYKLRHKILYQKIIINGFLNELGIKLLKR